VVVTDTLPATQTFVSATNSGTYNATTRVVTWSLGTLTAGSSTSLGLTVTIAPSATVSVSNKAVVTSAATDPNLANNSSTVTTTLSQVADVTVSKTTGQTTALVGDTITYTITVDNSTGPSDASTVKVTDVLPAALTFVSAVSATGTPTYNNGQRTLTWTVGTLAAGGTATLTLKAIAAVAGSVSNIATVSSTTPDPNTANNTSTAIVTIS
jgi:uncharacterized repeat protein (TIGR01451 family)